MAKIKNQGADLPAVEKPASASQKVEAEQVPQPLSQVSGDVMGLLNPDPTPEVAGVDPIASSPYLAFYHPLMKVAADVQSQHPKCAEGQPLIVDGDDITLLDTPWTFTLLRFSHYWAYISGEGDHSDVTFQNPGRADDRQHNIVTIALIDCPDKGVWATCTTWRSTKTKAVLSHIRALDVAAKPEWITKAPTADERKLRGAIASKVPVNMRMWSSVSLKARTSKKTGYVYHEATGTPRIIEPAAAGRLLNWIPGEEGDEITGADEIRIASEAYEGRVAYLKEIANRGVNDDERPEEVENPASE